MTSGEDKSRQGETEMTFDVSNVKTIQRSRWRQGNVSTPRHTQERAKALTKAKVAKERKIRREENKARSP
jgi:hypothetical protein